MVTQRSRPSRPKALRLKIIPPPKSVEQLAREQGVPSVPVDYSAIVSEIWPTEADVRAFDRHIRSIRGRPSR
jgi:hypothetical protein